MMIPTKPGTSGLTACISCAPTIELAADQPMHAKILKNATTEFSEATALV